MSDGQKSPAFCAFYLKHLEVYFALCIDIDALFAAFFTNVAEFFSHVYYSSFKVIKLIVWKLKLQ